MQHAGIWRESAGDPSNPLVVLVHGSMDRSSGMLRLSRTLDRDHLVLRYDRRGYGRSSHHGPYTVDQHVLDLLDVLEGRRAVLVGHSFGGNVALATAARHPHLVAGVAVFETPLSWESFWPHTTAGSQAVAHTGDPADAAEAFMRRLIGDQRWQHLPERTRAVRRAEGSAMVGELSDIRSTTPWHYHQIHVPLVAGYGSEGSPHHRTGMSHVVAQVPGAVLVEMRGCGHGAPNSHAERFRAEMVEPLMGALGETAGDAARPR